ncbi:major facilitator family transporter [Caballeronia calidae]|uniref:Major facilitator family transporter n=1 Tax=Caballeronia calidae TaxID=1777139 RepID=A0A158CKS4_9BURK|nr:MFS transporter [Caballeronia calidae]SAK82902.1 major facilitator family transporter [Caballeronia calidae]
MNTFSTLEAGAQDASSVRQTRPVISRAAVAGAVAGNALEFYDFVIYAFFAVYIGRAFFPAGGEFGSLLASMATFGVGFLMRPLGAIVIGRFADRAGRKPAMILTVVLITIGTLGLAATPAYSVIGTAAPVIVVICRLIQGFALGGEVGPSTALLVEAAPANRRGFYASWQLASQGMAVAVGGVIGVVVSLLLTASQLASWGWRIPFLFSLLLVPVAIYIRRHIPETLDEAPKVAVGRPDQSSLSGNLRYVVLGTLVLLAGAVSTQIGNYMTTFAIQVLNLPPTLAQVSVLIGGALTFVFGLAGGLICDAWGRKAAMIVPRVALAVLIVPMFWWLTTAPSVASLLLATAVLAALTAASAAAGLVAIPELMPARFRSTGIAITYGVGTAIFGGTTQFAVTWIISVTHSALAPAYYVVATSVISLAATFLLPETRNRKIDH